MPEIPIDPRKEMDRTTLRHPSELIPDDYDFHQALKDTSSPQLGNVGKGEIREYVGCIKNWMETLLVLDGRSVPTIIANPSRAFSSFTDAVSKGDVKPWPSDGAKEMDKHPLPFCCVSFGDYEIRRDVQGAGYPVRNMGLLKDAGKRRTAYTRYPTGILIPFQIDVYARFQNHKVYFDKAFIMQFWNGVATWFMQHPILDAKMKVPIRYVSHTSTTDLESDADKVIRTTMRVAVEGWLWDDVLQAPTGLRATDTYIARESGGDESTDITVATVSGPSDDAPPPLSEIAELPKDPPPDLQ